MRASTTPVETDGRAVGAPQRGADAAELSLWRRLRQPGGDEAARAQLLALHLPYARTIAAVVFGKRYHDEIEFGDYHQYASVGLLEAMDRFDPERGTQFRTFAARRMQGAILNGIERLTEKQQQISARRRARAEQLEAVKELAAQSAGSPDGGSSRSPEQLQKFMVEVGVGLALAWMLEGTAMVEDPGGSETIPFYRSAELRQLRERLAQLVEALPAAERAVIRSHYVQGLPFDQVALMLNLTKGRISQIHKQALGRLRARAGDAADLNLSC